MGFLANAVFGGALTPSATRTTPGQGAPEPIGLARLAVNPCIDGFGRDRTKANLDPLGQAPGDLLGRPAFRQTGHHITAQFAVSLQSGGALAAQKIRPFSGHGAIDAALQRVPL